MKRTDNRSRSILLFFLVLVVVLMMFFGGVYIFVTLVPDVLSLGNWQPLITIGKTTVRSLAYLDSQTIAAGLISATENNGGLVISYDGGNTWSRTDISRRNDVTAIIRPDPKTKELYIAAFNNNKNGLGGVYYSPDLGKSWQSRSTIPELLDVRSLIMLPGSPETLVAGTVRNGIFVSTDNGSSWQQSNNGLRSLQIQHLAVCSEDSDMVFAATIKGLFKSTDRAKSWSECRFDKKGPINMVLQVIPHPDNADIVYALERPTGPKTLIWRSNDRGNSWYRCGWSGLPSECHPRCLAVSPENPDDIFIGTVYDGVYCSPNGGRSWFPMNKGLPITRANIIIHALAFMPSTPPVLLAGTDYKGTIYRMPVTISQVKRFLATFNIRDDDNNSKP